MIWSLQRMIIPASHPPDFPLIAGRPCQSVVPSRVRASCSSLKFSYINTYIILRQEKNKNGWVNIYIYITLRSSYVHWKDDSIANKGHKVFACIRNKEQKTGVVFLLFIFLLSFSLFQTESKRKIETYKPKSKSLILIPSFW